MIYFISKNDIIINMKEFLKVKNRVKFSQYKSAFTLAEVLIVLGIIGVVAAFTIPTLMNKVQKHEYVVGLKKAYSTPMDGWSRLLADEGVDNLDDTSVFQSIEGACFAVGDFSDSDDCKLLITKLKKYFHFNFILLPKYTIKYLNGTEDGSYEGDEAFVFNDGSIMLMTGFWRSSYQPNVYSEEKKSEIKKNGGHMYFTSGAFDIDINGLKAPNTWGRDIFSFTI